MPSSHPKHRTWTRDGFLISTDPSLIPLQALNAAFASDMLYWAKPIPEDAMRSMLDNSLSFGLYSPTSSLPEETGLSDASSPQNASETIHEIAGHVQSHHQPEQTGAGSQRPELSKQESFSVQLIGFARCVTDHVTFVYLTDVYVLPAWQNQKLGKWLIQCVQEVVDSMPHLRKSMCIVSGSDDPSGKGGAAKFYDRLMGMRPLVKGQVIAHSGPGNTF